MNNDSHEFLIKTNKEVDEWMDSFYTDGRAGSFRSHCQWAWQEQERRKEAELWRLREQIEALEAMRPHWAKGYSSDSMAAQGQTSALAQVWSALGVKDQTACMEKLRSLLK